MHTTNLRKVGGSIMLAVPPALLDLLHLEAGSPVGLSIEGEHLVVDPNIKPRYTLDDLLSQCDLDAPLSRKGVKEDRGWIDLPPLGREL